jgi:hypothetical protein
MPRTVGYSTGALAPGDVARALAALPPGVRAVELSALRLPELGPLLAALPSLGLERFDYVSVHAPSRFTAAEEGPLAEALAAFLPLGYPVVLHPDTIHDFSVWARFGRGVAVENMDRRKARGRTADELRSVFDHLPEASFCFDVGHAHQVDRTMTDAWFLLRDLGDRLVQVHVSEISTRGRHDPLSRPTLRAFRRVAEGSRPASPSSSSPPEAPPAPRPRWPSPGTPSICLAPRTPDRMRAWTGSSSASATRYRG